MPRDQLFYVNGKQLKNITLPQYPDAAWDFITEPPDPANEDYYSSVAAVYRAANLTAGALANLPFALVNDKSGEDYDVSDAWENKVGFMPSPRELIRLWRLSLFMNNSAYGFMEGNRVISQLRYIVPSTIKPVVDNKLGLTGFKRTIGTTTTTYSLKERRIFYIWRLDHTTELLPSDHTEFKALMAAAGVLYYADYFTQNFFQRGGIKPTMLMVKGVPSREDREKIETIWDKVVHGWYKYLGKVFNAEAIEPHVIGEGIDNLKDSDLHQEKLSDISIAAGIPLSLLLSNSANYATAQTEYVSWYRDSIIPWADFMADIMTDQLFKLLGLRFEFRPEMTDPGQEDEVSRAQAYASYVNTGMLPSVAAQILGIELPPDMEYEDLDPDEEEEPEETTDNPQNVVLVEPTTDETPEEEAKSLAMRWVPTITQLREMELWQDIAFRKMRRGDNMDFPFELRALPENIGAQIQAKLRVAKVEGDILSAFEISEAPELVPVAVSEPEREYNAKDLIIALEGIVEAMANLDLNDGDDEAESNT